MSSTTSPRHFQFVDAMRGYAILSVILYHSVQVIPDAVSPYWILHQFALHCGEGVQLFFVISAFSLFWSLKNRRLTDRRPLLAFFARRLFRVAPLFWLAILFYLDHPDTFRDLFAPDGIAPWQVVVTALFVHGWSPTSVSSVVPGGWSIAVEMMFYLTLPFLFKFIRTTRTAFIVAMLSSAATAVAFPLLIHLLLPLYPLSWMTLIRTFVYDLFPIQFPVFCWGIVLYYLLTDDSSNIFRGVALVLAGAVLLVTGPPFLFLAIAFTLACWGLALYPIGVLVHRSIRFIGMISYSMYLWHFFIRDHIALFMVQSFHPNIHNPHVAGTVYFATLFLAVLAATMLLATASYYLIERPCINFGRWIIAALGWGTARQQPLPTPTIAAS